MTETALLIQQIRDPNNWTDDLFEKVDSFRVEHGDGDNILRRSLPPEIWGKFDAKYCKWKKPGQAIQVGNEILSNTGGQAKAVCDDGKARLLKETHRIRAITAAELSRMDIPPIEWIVDGLLPVGVSMLGAPSKYYKSYMALGLCVAVCRGEEFLGLKCSKHACLYFDLESTKRRPKYRLEQIAGDLAGEINNLYIIDGSEDPGRIGEGFEAQLEYQLQEHPEIRLVVVDVFQMIRQPAKKNQTGYDRDYDDFKILKKIADKHGICLMLIHHTRKMRDPSDAFNDLSGSAGVMGALDCAWVITRDKRDSKESTLHITGRDMESKKLKIQFNKRIFQWEYIGTVEDVEHKRLAIDYEQSPIIYTIKELIKQGRGRWEGSASEIKDASKYLGCKIYDDVSQIGRKINDYEEFLSSDSINLGYDRTNKGRKYIFTDTTVTTGTTVTEQMTFDFAK